MADDWLDEAPREALDLATIRAAVEDLSKLDAIAYDLQRKDEARRLGLSLSVLDAEVAKRRPKRSEPETDDVVETLDPWPVQVDGAAVAEMVRARLKAHVVFGAASDVDAVTLWIIGTYAMYVWRLWPKLLIGSPTKRCGKTTLLEVVEAFVFRAMMTSNLSAAVLFRITEKWQPTLLIDEADRFLRDNDALNGVINAGHTRRGASINRCVGDDHEVKKFSVWCPQVIAGIGSQEDTLVDRSIVVNLRRKLPDDVVDRLPVDLFERMLDVRRQLARWADDNKLTLGTSDLEPPPCGNDRRLDNFVPLWRIAAALGGPWPQRIEAAYAVSVADEDDDEVPGIMLLRDVAAVTEGVNFRIKTSDLVVRLIELSDRPWSDWKNGRPITGASIARLLKPFGIRPADYRFGDQILKGYDPARVREAFTRYCRPPNATPQQRNKINGLDHPQSATPVAAWDTANSLKTNDCCGVALPEGEIDDINNPDAWR